jgi:HAD superfamily hydrolase (TIGR01509 family)
MRAAECDAVLFDLDGVLTDTAAVHEKAWAALFTELFDNPAITMASDRPYSTADYFTYIDGKPRNQGVLAVLSSRGIDLPVGAPDDDPDALTVNGLGNRKNSAFLAAIGAIGAMAYPGSVEILDWLAEQGIPRGVVSSSRNAEAVLTAAGLRERIDLVLDGNAAAGLGLAGKPAPDTYLRAAETLRVTPSRTVVVEDAVSGVAAGRSGGFWVIGIDRGAGRQKLLEHGADAVIVDLDELFAPRAAMPAGSPRIRR